MLKVLSAGAANAVVNGVSEQAGIALGASFGAVGVMKDRLTAGEACDVIAITREMIEELVVANLVADYKGNILSLPYPHEVNDIPMIALHHGTAPAFADMVINNFNEMLEQSKKQSLVYGIAIHAFLIGQPFRLRHFRRALEHIAEHRDKVWITTSGDIAQHFIDRAPIKPGA